jgi:hypothetical protein
MPAAYAALHTRYAFEGRGMIETAGRSHMLYSLVGRRDIPVVPAR